MSKITKTEIRMYRMGTGDCFILKFFAGAQLKFKMMIDCGTWQGSKANLTPFIEDLKAYVGNHLDLLVVTHEHKDHVHVFDACKDLFTAGFTIDKVWMGWTEEEGNPKVKQWQREHGEQKMALAAATKRLQAVLADPAYAARARKEANGLSLLAAQGKFTEALGALAELQLNAATGYVGMLAGMKVVKESLGKNKTEYFKPGNIIANIAALPGIKFYVLGPPLTWAEAKTEAGGEGESYNHNKDLPLRSAFAAAVLGASADGTVAPFDDGYDLQPATTLPRNRYDQDASDWRRIDHDWLNSAGALALRVNSITNNLSLALAIEFEDSGRVMLFPGDAEYGSWASWHRINWNEPPRTPGKHLTEDLLNRTVFYKVAHHLSHNGTAERLGLEMMNHPDLAAMATLDYAVISSGWKTTMPNRAIIGELLNRTKGRLMIMQERDLFFDKDKQVPVADKVREARAKMTVKQKKAFQDNYTETDLYLQYVVHAEA
jgi:hypothetical protein